MLNDDNKKNKSLTKVDNDFAETEQIQNYDNEETNNTESKSNNNVKETLLSKKDNNNNLSSIIIAIIAIIILIAMLFFGYRYITTGTATYSSEPAQEVINQQENPSLKADKLDSQKIYNLKDSKDVANNMEITIKKAQFRKDQTRLWLHFKNSGSQKINMMPNINSVLIDNNGHSYKVDSFSGDQITSVAPGTDEDIMLVFAPIRSDAKSITYNLDSVFDLKKSAWNYSITVDLP